MSEDAFRLPEDLTGISDEELASLHERAVAEFTEIYEAGATTESLARANELADAIEKVSGERGTRAQAVTEAAERFEQLRGRVQATQVPDEPDPAPQPKPEDVPGGGGDEPEPPAEPAEPAPSQEPALVADGRRKTNVRDVVKSGTSNLNARLSDAARYAPNPRVPERNDDLVITAATPTAGAPIGTRIDTMDRLIKTIANYAKGTAITHGQPNYVPLASIQNNFDVVLSDRTSPAEVEEKLKALTNPDVLVAAGGWCAPPQIRYDFFDVTCEDGLIDLPTIGIERGGITFPVSPSLADVFDGTFTNGTVPWVWTNNDDIAAATGGGGTKPCVRVPCPDFETVLLECYGICLTAGNLTDAAYPEATRNYLRLLMAALERAMNIRYLAQMVAQSTNVGTIGAAGSGAAAPLLGAVELAAIDYRIRYGMCRDAILEVILPSWVQGVIRSDLAKRTGVNLLDVTNEMIADWFDTRRVRVQLVTDWQVRATGLPGFSTPATAWPTTVDFLLFAAGTFVRGNGMSLDLGVVRDSTLNATNDFTAAWAEQCHLIAKLGHESRMYTVNICTDGTTGAADLTACGL
ncbi:major capsid protein [Micromonospora sp. CPCC 205371]|nr:major capsid protein [Micromonospora sp. CPCC 205371]